MRKNHLKDGFRPFLFLLFVALATALMFACQAPEEKEEDKVTEGVDHPDWSVDDVIYEVNIRQYTPEGTFKAFEEHLPRLRQMGVDILWLMPIHPIGEKNRKGPLGSYYSVKDYLAVNPEFGDQEDFRSLVKKIHELDMYVIIDWVANHTSWDNHLIDEHPDWYQRDSLGKLVSPFDWTDVVSLDYEEEGLRDYMRNALAYWVAEENIDGYRCDVASLVPTDFWNSVRDTLEKIKPVFMLAEAELPEHHEDAFDMSYGWNIHHIMNEVAQGKQNANDLHAALLEDELRFPDHAYRMYFTSNHDENSWNGTVYERLGDGVETFAALTYVMPGMPLIYSGQEAGLDKRLEFFEKDTISWETLELQNLYTTLNALKHDNKALWNGQYGGEYRRVESTDDQRAMVIYREKDDNKVLGVFNLSDTTLNNLRLKGEMHIDNYTDLFEGTDVVVDMETVFDLKPWAYKILYK